MQPVTSPRIATAYSSAWTARRDFIRESVEYPTIRLLNALLIAQQ